MRFFLYQLDAFETYCKRVENPEDGFEYYGYAQNLMDELKAKEKGLETYSIFAFPSIVKVPEYLRSVDTTSNVQVELSDDEAITEEDKYRSENP